MAHGESESDDAFDEDAEPLRIAEAEWQKMSNACVKEGLREGISSGKERALQEGFDRGFQEGFQLVKDVSVWRGFIKGISSSMANSEPLKELCDQLAALERDLLNGKKPSQNVAELKSQVADVLGKMELGHLVAAIEQL